MRGAGHAEVPAGRAEYAGEKAEADEVAEHNTAPAVMKRRAGVAECRGPGTPQHWPFRAVVGPAQFTRSVVTSGSRFSSNSDTGIPTTVTASSHATIPTTMDAHQPTSTK